MITVTLMGEVISEVIGFVRQDLTKVRQVLDKKIRTIGEVTIR